MLRGSGVEVDGHHGWARDASVQYEEDRFDRRAEYDAYYTGEYYKVGTLPLEVLLHGFGSDARSLASFASLADSFHFVLV